MLLTENEIRNDKFTSVLLAKHTKRSNRCKYDKRLSKSSFFTSVNRTATLYHYRSQNKHYIVMVFKGGMKLYSTNGVSFSGNSLAMHSVIEGVFGI